jgi:hypothetical protein
MTREEQIIEAGQEYRDSMDEFQRYHTYPREAFIDGAKWADASPQFSKEKFIERACEWLELHINDDKYYSCIGEETLVPYLIDDFKRAMEE